MSSKKEKLITSLKALREHIPELREIIAHIEKIDFSKADRNGTLNETLTRIISRVLVHHPEIMDRDCEESKKLREFCQHQVGPIEPVHASHTKRRRL